MTETAGPWEYHDATGYRFLIHHGKKVVAEVHQANNPEARDDARLLAAAPELRDALGALVEAVYGATPPHGWCEWIADSLRVAGAALGKAGR